MKVWERPFVQLFAIFLLLGAIFLVSLHMHLREMLHIEAEAKAELIFAHLSSVQDYVRTTLRPAASQALPADNFVKVDVYVPGCPPDADTIYYVFQELLEGRMPKVPSDMMRYD